MLYAWLTLCKKLGDPSIKITQKIHWLGIFELFNSMFLLSALEQTG